MVDDGLDTELLAAADAFQAQHGWSDRRLSNETVGRVWWLHNARKGTWHRQPDRLRFFDALAKLDAALSAKDEAA